MSLLITPPTIRVFRKANEWQVRDLALRTSWRIDQTTAATLTAFMQPRDPQDVVRELCSVRENADIAQRIRVLTETGLLQQPGNEAYSLPEWARRGWPEAHDYIEAAWDYPFVDYSERGQEIDKARMRAYAAAKPDDVRTLPQKGTTTIALPGIEQSLAALDHAADLGLRERLMAIAAVAALPIETKRSRTPGADYIHRTSPSGGSRHPSEVYLLALDVDGLTRGVHHVATGEATLGFVQALPDETEMKKGLPGAFRLAAPPRAIFVVSTHFERNMYRYREPRTLRTVYYDAGHLGGLIEALGDNDGLIAHGHHGFSDRFVANLVRSGSLAEEAPSYLVSIGMESEMYEGTRRIGASIVNTRPTGA